MKEKIDNKIKEYLDRAIHISKNMMTHSMNNSNFSDMDMVTIEVAKMIQLEEIHSIQQMEEIIITKEKHD